MDDPYRKNQTCLKKDKRIGKMFWISEMAKLQQENVKDAFVQLCLQYKYDYIIKCLFWLNKQNIMKMDQIAKTIGS